MDARTLIYLLRHGAVDLGGTRRFIGHLDLPLSPAGERQAGAQAERLRHCGLVAVFASDLSRARRTAEIIASPHALEPMLLPALREMDMGRWEGLSSADIQAREPVAFAEWMAHLGEFPFPGGESLGDLLVRAWPAFDTIVQQHRGRSIAVVAHGGTNRALICRALGLPLDRILTFGQDYGALNVLEHVSGNWRLRQLNECPAL